MEILYARVPIAEALISKRFQAESGDRGAKQSTSKTSSLSEQDAALRSGEELWCLAFVRG